MNYPKMTCNTHNWILVNHIDLYNNPKGKKYKEFEFVCPDCEEYKIVKHYYG